MDFVRVDPLLVLVVNVTKSPIRVLMCVVLEVVALVGKVGIVIGIPTVSGVVEAAVVSNLDLMLGVLAHVLKKGLSIDS